LKAGWKQSRHCPASSQSWTVAPGTVHARTAYTILEAVFVEGYSGSGGTHLPPEVERRLASLRDLLEAAPERAAEKVSK